MSTSNDKLFVLSKQIASILKRVGEVETSIAEPTSTTFTGTWNDNAGTSSAIVSEMYAATNNVKIIVPTITGTFGSAPASNNAVVHPFPIAATTAVVTIGVTDYTATISTGGAISIADIPTAVAITIPSFTFTYTHF
jgi:hypothetical protein